MKRGLDRAPSGTPSKLRCLRETSIDVREASAQIPVRDDEITEAFHNELKCLKNIAHNKSNILELSDWQGNAIGQIRIGYDRGRTEDVYDVAAEMAITIPHHRFLNTYFLRHFAPYLYVQTDCEYYQ